MIDKSTARKIVLEYINASYEVDEDELVIVDEETIDRGYGWVFFYTSQQWLETGEIRFAVAGNGPIIVERENGALTELGTALPPEDLIKQYEARKNKK